jgi:hypothetical protein
MSRPAMARRCPGARALGVARLAGWRFSICRQGFATLVRAPGRVFGVVWSLTPADEARLDAYEETAAGLYRKERVQLPRRGPAVLYLANSDRSGVPLPGYLEGVLAAAAAARLPASYRGEIARWQRKRR